MASSFVFHSGSNDPDHGRTSGSSSCVKREADRLKSGEQVMISGRPFTLTAMSREDCALKLPDSLSNDERSKFQALYDTLVGIGPHIQQISERLQDPNDGATSRFAKQLVIRLSDFPSGIQKPLRDYLISIIKCGSTLLYPRMCTIAPQVSADHLVAALHHHAPELMADPDFGTFMQRTYSSVPLSTGGFFLFKDATSEARFHEAVLKAHPEFREHLKRIDELFSKMTHGIVLSSDELDQYDILSINYHEKQRLFIEGKLDAWPDSSVKDLSTRVHISVDEHGNFTFTPQHYTSAFRQELDCIADILQRALRILPETAPDWPELLRAFEEWARNPSTDAAWAESLTRWLKTSDPANILDMNMCAEENGSHIGKKGDFQFSLYQYAELPQSMRSLMDGAKERAKEKGVSIIVLNGLVGAGYNLYFTAFGENLPNSERIVDGKPVQRSMTFANLTHKGAFLSNAINLARVLDFTPDDLERFTERMITVMQVAAHEFGHTFDHDEKPNFLSSRSTHVAETDGQASALYLVALYSPQDSADMARQVGCWIPCRRARQGLGSPHTQSDLVMFEKYHQAGGVEVANRPDGSAYLRIRDLKVMEDTAFAMALQVRLWQRGVPLKVQRLLLRGVEFDRNSPEQADTIVSSISRDLDALKQSEPTRIDTWKQRVLREVESCYSLPHMREIEKILGPVIAALNPSQPLLVMPGDARLEMLMEFA